MPARTGGARRLSDIAYDPAKDFAGIAMIGVVPNMLLIAPSKNVKSAKELAKRARAGDLTYACAGVGRAARWAAERLGSVGLTATASVPRRAGRAHRGDDRARRLHLHRRLPRACRSSVTASGVPLAVTTQKRSAALPDVPTTLELGLRGSDSRLEQLPRAGPDAEAIIERLRGETAKVLAQPAVEEKLGLRRRAAAALAHGVDE